MLVSQEQYVQARDGYDLLRRGLALIQQSQDLAPQGSLERELLGESADRAVLAIEYAELAMRDMTVAEPRPEGDTHE